MGKIAAKEGEKRPLPGSYSEMYPNRFLKADMLKGHKVTLTIKDISGEGLMSEDKGSNLEWIVSFAERDKQFVMNKTNATCLYRMFGGDPKSWIGHRITLFPTTVFAFGANQDCLRVWGSPDIAEDLSITVPQGRKKAWETVMHKTGTAHTNGQTPTSPPPENQSGLDPRIAVAFGLLGWDAPAQSKFIIENLAKGQPAMIAELNRLLDTESA
jgi:hypothetical protein